MSGDEGDRKAGASKPGTPERGDGVQRVDIDAVDVILGKPDASLAEKHESEIGAVVTDVISGERDKAIGSSLRLLFAPLGIPLVGTVLSATYDRLAKHSSQAKLNAAIDQQDAEDAQRKLIKDAVLPTLRSVWTQMKAEFIHLHERHDESRDLQVENQTIGLANLKIGQETNKIVRAMAEQQSLLARRSPEKHSRDERNPEFGTENSIDPDSLPVYRWLHISDIHIGCRGEAVWWQVVEDFFKSLDRWLPKAGGAPDLVIITGDMTNRGAAKEYERFTRFLDQVTQRLTDRGSSSPLVIPVPGNHEVQRPTGTNAFAYKVIDSYEQRASDPIVGDFHEQLWVKREPGMVGKLFTRYEKWFSDHIEPAISSHPHATLHRGVLPGDLTVTLRAPGRFPLAIVGVNSAWSQYTGGDFRGRLHLPIEQFQAALPKADRHASPLAYFATVERALLLMHHPRAWLTPASRTSFDGLVYHPDRFTACLFGHMHEAAAVNVARAGGSPRCHYQSPSLFGLEKYGARDESRLFGYSFGQVRQDGEVRAWPLRSAPRGDGVWVFDKDTYFHWEDDERDGVILRYPDRGWRPPTRARAASRPRTSTRASASQSDDPEQSTVAVVEPAVLVRYRAWLRERRSQLELAGVGGGEMNLDLDAVYVTLSAAPHDRCERMPGSDGEPCGPEDEVSRVMLEPASFEVDSLFRALPSRHALILGHPGSGKTTALQKMLHRVVHEGPESINLAAGTVPLWLPLRHFSKPRAGASLTDWIREELHRADPELPTALADALWQHGRILLLADGLDEVADEALRARLCDYLHFYLQQRPESHAVVTCRYSGYREGVRLHDDFYALDLRPLSEAQVDELVTRWFAEAAKHMPSIAPSVCLDRAASLKQALKGPLFADRRRKIMRSTPLLLTLLCVIVNQGREMPSNRVAFYEECLAVMLSRWGIKTKEWREPPLDVATATAILQRLAYVLHSAGERDDQPRAVWVRESMGRLKALRKPPTLAHTAIRWLHNEAGVLREFAPEHLGFFHLGVQEYLCAAYIGKQLGEHVDALVRQLGTPWWHEVTRLLVSLPNVDVFGPLVARVLREPGWSRHIGLLHDWIDEAPTADAAPFVAFVDSGPPEDEMIAALGVLDRFVGDERVSALAGRLASSESKAVQRLAADLLARERETSRGPSRRAVALLFREGQRRVAQELAAALRRRGFTVLRGQDKRLANAGTLAGARLEQVSRAAACVVVLADASGPGYAGVPGAEDALALWAMEDKRIVGARVGDDAPRWPDALEEPGPWIDVRGRGAHRLDAWIRDPDDERGASRVTVSRGESFTEPGTGIRFLEIKGGSLAMGQAGVRGAKPVRRVRLSRYWLAETPVTNGQYARFLEALASDEELRRRHEPRYWLDERFAGETRPVVGVSWHDAMAFCAWLSSWATIKRAGLVVTLPSEAQWEFAARGADGRVYPWGNDAPDASRVVFGRRESADTTAPVKSCPNGQGPFGHHDLLGNVWEWCRDAWAKDAYEQREPGALDPVHQAKTRIRSLRGYCWRSSGVGAAAVRGRSRSVARSSGIGFRVAAVPASR